MIIRGYSRTLQDISTLLGVCNNYHICNILTYHTTDFRQQRSGLYIDIYTVINSCLAD